MRKQNYLNNKDMLKEKRLYDEAFEKALARKVDVELNVIDISEFGEEKISGSILLILINNGVLTNGCDGEDVS